MTANSPLRRYWRSTRSADPRRSAGSTRLRVRPPGGAATCYKAMALTATEAAAATGITMRATAMRMPEQAVVFRADHPFIFLIRDTRSGVVLFIGRLMNPR